METDLTGEEEIVIGDCLTREEAEEIITVLAQDGALQDLLVEAQVRSDQHRQNYVKLKGEHERLIHQLKVMESEMTKLETEKQQLETEIRSERKYNIRQIDFTFRVQCTVYILTKSGHTIPESHLVKYYVGPQTSF